MRTRQRLISESLLKYIVVGISAVIVDYGSFYILYSKFNAGLVLANSIGFVLGLCASFFLNRIWSFKSSGYSKKAAHQLAAYLTLAVVNLVVTNLLIVGMVKLGIPALIAKLIAIAMTTIWNYLLFKFIIFKADDSANNSQLKSS